MKHRWAHDCSLLRFVALGLLFVAVEACGGDDAEGTSGPAAAGDAMLADTSDAGAEVNAALDPDVGRSDAGAVDAPDAISDSVGSDAADSEAEAAADADAAAAAGDAGDIVDEPWTPPPHPHADSILLSDRFLNIAHRGGGRLAPEGTTPAYENAVAVGADVIECDVHSTADGVLVCMHDDTVDRTTDGTGTIHGFTFEELRALDAGYAFTRDGGASHPYRGTGVQVPTLEEFFATPDAIAFSIEIKQAAPMIAVEVVETIERLGVADRTVVASFPDHVIAVVREANPDLITALSLGEMLAWVRVRPADEAAYRPPGQVLQIPPAQGDLDLLAPELLARADRLGMKIQVWTINSRARMEELMDIGVDGIFTDDPALLQEVVDARE